jgi:transposase
VSRKSAEIRVSSRYWQATRSNLDPAMFYGSDSHAESAAAIFSLIASCRLHSIDPQQYLDEVMRVLPYWPKHRYLELAPRYWQATRSNLDPAELDAELCPITVPRVALNFAR